MLGDPWFMFLAVPAVIFAGASKGGFGSGAAFLATPILALVVAPGTALAVLLPLLVLVDIVTLKPYWRHWQWRQARLLILGAAPGVVLGGVFLSVADADLLRLLIGAVALLFVGYRLLVVAGAIGLPRQTPGMIAGLVAGLAAGFTSFISHAGGPAAAVYLLASGLGKTPYQATTVLVFSVVNAMKIAGYAWLGLFTADTLRVDLALTPFALFGAWIGVKAHHLVPERVFFAITYVMLTGAGTKLVFDALT